MWPLGRRKKNIYKIYDMRIDDNKDFKIYFSIEHFGRKCGFD